MSRLSPILVTGSHRSGTTWVGRLLCASGEAGYIQEPFNVDRVPGWAAGRISQWFQYICSDNEDAFQPLMDQILAFQYPVRRQLSMARNLHLAGRLAIDWQQSLYSRLRHARPLLKDPIAIFSAEWLADRFGAQPVVLIRHPAAFVSSIKRLGWAFDFSNWAQQPLLIRDHLGLYDEQIRAHAHSRRDIIDQAILMWNVIYHIVGGYRDRWPDWLFVRHEDLARKPIATFQALYQALGLRWGPRVETTVGRFSLDARLTNEVPPNKPGTIRRDSKSTVLTWHSRLSPGEIERVRSGVEAVASQFYSEDDWRVAAR